MSVDRIPVTPIGKIMIKGKASKGGLYHDRTPRTRLRGVVHPACAKNKGPKMETKEGNIVVK